MADLIVVLDRGRGVAAGSDAELVALRPVRRVLRATGPVIPLTETPMMSLRSVPGPKTKPPLVPGFCRDARVKLLRCVPLPDRETGVEV